MDKIDIKEKLFGGIFGIISIAASVVEMCANGITVASIAGMIKDVFATLVVVVVMISVAKMLSPKKYKFSFEERLTNALEKWQKENSNMIIKEDGLDDRFYSIKMKTNVKDFYEKVPLTTNAGWFVRLPVISAENYNKENIEINFHLNKGTFFSNRPTLTGEELKNEFDKLNSLFVTFISRTFDTFIDAGGKDDNIKIRIKEPIVTDEDINKLIEVIDTMYQAYLVAANIGGSI